MSKPPSCPRPGYAGPPNKAARGGWKADPSPVYLDALRRRSARRLDSVQGAQINCGNATLFGLSAGLSASGELSAQCSRMSRHDNSGWVYVPPSNESEARIPGSGGPDGSKGVEWPF